MLLTHILSKEQVSLSPLTIYDRGHTQNIGLRGLDTMYKQLTDAVKKRVDAL